jgi:hypothetical protein
MALTGGYVDSVNALRFTRGFKALARIFPDALIEVMRR